MNLQSNRQNPGGEDLEVSGRRHRTLSGGETVKPEHCLYKIEPEYRSDNLSFFEENVFLYEEDMLSKHLSMQDLMRNQILNSNDFGKLSVCSNGDMYTDELSSTVGNIWTNDVRKLIYKEMVEGHSWLRIRDQKPCCDYI